MDATLPIINRTYDVYKHLVEATGKLEKRWRYSLGQNVENAVLDLLSDLIMAKNAPKPLKAGYLLKGSARLEILRLKCRLLLELGLVNDTKIFQAQSQLAEIGRMLGGWLKSLGSQ